MKILIIGFVFFLILIFIPDIQKGLDLFFSSPLRHVMAAFAGITFYGWMSFKKEGEELPYFLKLLFVGVNLFFFSVWGVAFFLEISNVTDVLAHIFFLLLGMLLVALLERTYIPAKDWLVKIVTKKSSTERTHRTDVREIEDVLPLPKNIFDPEQYFKPGVFF